MRQLQFLFVVVGVAIITNPAIGFDFTTQLKMEKSIDKAFDHAAKAIVSESKTTGVPSSDTQSKLEAIFHDLDTISDENLYFLKASSDVCATPRIFNCRGLPSGTVKPFVEMTLEKRKSVSARKDSERTFYISSGGFCVSVISLFFSAIATFRSRRLG